MVWTCEERIDEYRMCRTVLMGSKWRAGTEKTEIRLVGWCEGGFGQ